MPGMAVVYSSDCPAGLKRAAADGTYVYQCSGTSDQTVINAAISAVAATGQTSSSKPSGGGGSVLLVGYNFNLTAPIQLQSWVDLGGAFGRAGCQVNASPGFSGMALIVTGQTYTEMTTVHDLMLNGSGSGTEHGIYCNGQVTQTPFTYSDPVHKIRDLVIMNSGGAGLYFDTAVRVTHVSGLRIGKAGTYGIYGGGLVDSYLSDVQILGSGSDGVYAAGGDTTYNNVRSDNSHANGFNIQSTRTAFVNCQAEDSTQHNFSIQSGKVLLAGCVSDSAGLGSGSPTYDGFNIATGLTDISMTGCQSYDRNGSPHQRYGVFIGTTGPTQSRVQCNTYGNATGSFGGNTTPGTGSVYDVYGT